MSWFDYINANPVKPWNYEELSANPNVTWDIVEANPDKPWDYSGGFLICLSILA